jgi:hypothetical protein
MHHWSGDINVEALMLLHYPKQSFECFRHADVCRRRAHAAADTKRRDEFLAMEERWRMRALTYELVENRLLGPDRERLFVRTDEVVK